MTLNQQYLMYTFADDLVKNHQFDLLYVNEKNNEIWLEKYENRSSKVVRLIHKGFDWKNHLKQDISLLFQRVRNVKNLFGKNIEVYNLYFTSYPPVDAWESLKKPLNSKGKPNVQMKVYYFDAEDYIHEVERFQRDFLSAPIDYNMELPDEMKVNAIERIKHELFYLLQHKKNEMKDIFSFGKPLFTYALLIINLLIFFYIEMNGGSTSIETLIQYGAKYNPAIIMDGEWWRLISSIFIHIGFLHLAMNMLAIYYLGNAVEKIYGNSRFLIIYFISGLGGSLASFALTTNISAGASGAIFGLFGAFLYFGLVHKRLFFQTMGPSILFILAINLVLGLTVEQIDMAAHIGGLIAGFLAASVVGLPKKKHVPSQMAAALLTTLLMLGVLFYGVSTNESNQVYKLMEIQEHLNRNDFQEAVEAATDAMMLEGEMESTILFQRSYAYIELGRFDEARNDLEESITYNDALPEAYYNLALLYEMDGETEKAQEAIEQALRMNPGNDDFQRLYEELTGKPPSND